MSLSKKLDRLTPTAIEEIIQAPNPAGLHKVVSDSEASLAKATKERDANPEYQKAKQACADLSAGLREVRKFQKAKAALALAILGEDDLSEEDKDALEIARAEVFRSQKKTG